MAGLRDRFHDAARRRDEEQAGIQRITDILAGDGVPDPLPDPLDEQDRMDVGFHCKAVIDPDADIAPQIMPYVEEARIAPKPGVDALEEAFIAGEPGVFMMLKRRYGQSE